MIIGFFIKHNFSLNRDDYFVFLVFSIMFIMSYSILARYKIIYDNKQIHYRGLFGTKTLDILNIKKLQIKVSVDRSKPTIGLYIDTNQKKSAIVIPVKVFDDTELNEMIRYINKIIGSSKNTPNNSLRLKELK